MIIAGKFWSTSLSYFDVFDVAHIVLALLNRLVIKLVTRSESYNLIEAVGGEAAGSVGDEDGTCTSSDVVLLLKFELTFGKLIESSTLTGTGAGDTAPSGSKQKFNSPPTSAGESDAVLAVSIITLTLEPKSL